MSDLFDLQRFLDAQEKGDPGTYEDAMIELQKGQKDSHWMWYVFPQIEGLGHTEKNVRYAIGNGYEARAYLAHPDLGQRLKDAARAVLDINGKDALAIFGKDDTKKLKSSMTLFEHIDEAGSLFGKVLEKYFDGERDGWTLEILKGQQGVSGITDN